MMTAAILLLAAAETMTFSADRIAIDNVTKAGVVTGHVHATVGVVTLRGEQMTRDADGLMHFYDPTYVTTCSNEVGHTHWNVTGDVEYKAEDYVLLRNAWVKFYEVPIFWLPYLWYPLKTDCGFSWMPGWTSEWGAYLLTKTSYHIIGDSNHSDDTWWLRGDTRFDWRYEKGLGLGEDLKWNLNGFGKGHFKVYYAWDNSEDYGDNGDYRNGDLDYYSWGSDVPDNRWSMELAHRWEPTERDTIRVKGSIESDSYFKDDFFRDSLFNIKNQWLGYNGNEVAWEHLENSFGAGVSVSGPLNKFYGGTSRLPEFYFDVAPQPVWDLPINYESQTRVGYLARQPAEYGAHASWNNAYAYVPGNWADYETFRIDTYHRLTAPFKTFDDVLSVVPRLGYRGTYWNACGGTHISGYDQEPRDYGERGMYRSIFEAGSTFAARGTADVNEEWAHVIEPYFDVLAQEASIDGARNGKRPYVFDNLDSSMIWEDQFAGRGRNLPYTYYGVTPGFRQAWQQYQENGNLREVVDFDLYAAIQLNQTDWYDDFDSFSGIDRNRYHLERHKLATAGDPNYGESGCMIVPGSRLRWMPDDTITVLGNIEYNEQDHKVALADLGWRQVLSKKFKYDFKYSLRDYRIWDYSSSAPVRAKDNRYIEAYHWNDDNNLAYYHCAQAKFEHHVLDWFHWSPFLRWDLKDGELDSVGAWFDYLVDCLGFRFIVSYDNKYTLYDGYERGGHAHFGFLIYLRALGADGSNIFNN